MVDWELVERRRTKGWDWDRIAGDPKVGFHVEEAAGDRGRALRALYYQRRSKSKRSASPGRTGSDFPESEERRWTLERVGAILVPMLAVWFVLALLVPSPVGAFVPAIPDLLLALLGSVAFLAFALLRSANRWNPTIRNSVVAGVVLGLVVAGSFGIAAVASGCPTLTSATTGEPANFSKANDPAWTDGGVPVFFFDGSTACPFCSASSWTMSMALGAFGTLSGTSYDRSNPGDSFPNTPEVVLAGAALQSRWVSLRVAESTNDNQITAAPTTGCVEPAYVNSYDSHGYIPFVVIDGQYFHVGAMVDPAKLAGLSPPQVQGQLDNQSGPAWNAISPTAYLLEAFLVKANGGQPASVANDPSVAALLRQIR